MLKQGDIVGGRYEIVDLLQEGQCVRYYSAQHRELDMRYCVHEYDLEVITESNINQQRKPVEHDDLLEHFAARLLTELKEYALLKHPNLQRVVDLFRSGLFVYCVTPYFGDVRLLQSHSFSLPASLKDTERVIRSMADVLKYLHNHQFCHLTFCPGDILLTESDKIILLCPSFVLQLPGVGLQPVHSKMEGFAAPERYSKFGQVCPEMDTYSLTALLYYLLTSQRPPSSITFTIDHPLPHNKMLSDEVYSFLRKGMDPVPEKRFCSIKEWLVGYDKLLRDQSTVESYASKSYGDSKAQKSSFARKRQLEGKKREYVPQGNRPRPIVKPHRFLFGVVLLALAVVVALSLMISVLTTNNTINSSGHKNYQDSDAVPSLELYNPRKIKHRGQPQKEYQDVLNREDSTAKEVIPLEDSTRIEHHNSHEQDTPSDKNPIDGFSNNE
ncbi:protein kinase domain-containing protein [Falsiporphyromonas endometrii]|uniref:Protein kinase domain-containing protein n=1 Tax=Falsiporphyromonas endometrii TaxID=1387297 RepID=A0ABV9K7N2_9PORP